MTDEGNARAVRAFELAESQCTDGELRMAIKVEFKMTLQAVLKWLEPMEEELDSHRMHGRALIRCKVYKLASGDPELGASLTRTNVVAMELFGRQHLGYTGEGVDARVRKAVEKSERKNRGLKAVS